LAAPGGGGTGFLGSPHPRHRRFSCGKIHPYPLKLHFCLPLRPAPFLTLFDHFWTPKKTPNLDPHFGGGSDPPFLTPPWTPPPKWGTPDPQKQGKNRQEKPSIQGRKFITIHSDQFSSVVSVLFADDLPPCKPSGRGRTLVMRRKSSPKPIIVEKPSLRFLTIFGLK
jgi:hypothetical protein